MNATLKQTSNTDRGNTYAIFTVSYSPVVNIFRSAVHNQNEDFEFLLNEIEKAKNIDKLKKLDERSK